MHIQASVDKRWLSAYVIIVLVTALGWLTVLSPPVQVPARSAPAAAKAATLEDAEKAYQEASALTADLLWMNVERYWHGGNHDKIIELCYHIVDLDSTFVEAYNAAAWLLWSQLTPEGDKAAVEMYERGIKANPEDWEIPFECGAFYFFSHKRDARSALPYLRLAAERAEHKAPAHRKVLIFRFLGHSLRKTGDTQEALKAYRKVLEIDPNDAVALKEIRDLERAQR